MEIHPRISQSDSILYNNKKILGSFPTWALTPPDLLKNETKEEKELHRNKNNDINFFYGSSANRFWLWYKEFVDCNIAKTDIKNIKKSLKTNKIGITDVIFQCNRKNKSSYDSDLSERLYNHTFFKYPSKGKVIKVLCTSKGVIIQFFKSEYFSITFIYKTIFLL